MPELSIPLHPTNNTNGVNGGMSKGDPFEQIIADSGSSKLLSCNISIDPEYSLETPSVAHRRDTSFFPRMPERIVDALGHLPGKAWLVFLVIWRESAMKHDDKVRLSSAYLKHFRITPNQKARALAALEEAGLIVVRRRGKKNPLVTLKVEFRPWKEGQRK